MDIPKDDDRNHLFKARPLNNKVYCFRFHVVICLHQTFHTNRYTHIGFVSIKQIVSSRQDIGIFRKSKQDTTVPLVCQSELFFTFMLYISIWSFFPTIDSNCAYTQTQEFSFHSEKRCQPDLPTDLFSKVQFSARGTFCLP